MKKYITFLLCLIMLLSLVSCNETNDELDAQLSDDAENTTVQETPENTIVPDNKEDSVKSAHGWMVGCWADEFGRPSLAQLWSSPF